jgi:DNA-binding HxlR family transcriptional regulator
MTNAAPRPGKKVRGSDTGRPIMALLDLLGRRWALRILWELHTRDACTFRDLQTACGDISPSVLNSRIGELRQAGFVENIPSAGYQLTSTGRNLITGLTPLNTFAANWAAQLEKSAG